MVESMIDGSPKNLESLLSGVVSEEALAGILAQRDEMQGTLRTLELARDNIDGLGESLARVS